MPEIELKYIVKTDDLDRIIPALQRLGAKIVSDQVNTSHTTYFDTPRCRLRDAGLELRVRDTAGRFVQTLKSKGRNRQSIFVRDEAEHELSTMWPDLTLIQKEINLYSLRSLHEKHLHPVFETKIERRSIDIEWRGCRVSIAVDNGIIASRRRKVKSRSLSEIELELIDGDVARLLQFGFELNEVLNLRLNNYSKADFGYSLAVTRFALRPVNWEDLSKDMGAEASLRDLLSLAFVQLLKNNPEQIHNRLESIHQTRVAIRRIRALLRGHKGRLDFLERKGINAELKWVQTKLGAARDWQVLKHESLPIIQPHLEINIAKLERYVDIQTRHHLKSAMLINSSHRYNRLLSRLLVWIENLECDTTRDLKSRAKRLKTDLKNFQRLSRMPARAFPKNIHDLRIRTKKLRYMLEIHHQSESSTEVRLIKEVKSLQSLLGKFNDFSKSLELLSAATPAEIPATMNTKLRKIIADEMDRLFNISKPQFKRVKAVIRQVQKRD